MKRLLPLFLAVAFSMAAACVNPTYNVRPKMDRMPWPEEEYSKLNIDGDCEITGQAFLRTRGGDVKTAAGSEVILSPVTSYSRQFVEIVIQQARQGVDLAPADGRVFKYIKKTNAGVSGDFRFKNVAEGDYYLYTTVTWEALNPYGQDLSRQGGWVYRKVTVKSGGENHFIVTGQ